MSACSYPLQVNVNVSLQLGAFVLQVLIRKPPSNVECKEQAVEEVQAQPAVAPGVLRTLGCGRS